MKSRICLLFISISLLFYFKLTAQSTIAEVSTYNSGIYITCGNTNTPITINVSVGQTFKSLLTATITTVQFNIYNIIGSGTVNLEIYSCSSGTSWGSLLGTESNVVVNTSGAISIDVSSLNISVTANNYYGFRIVPNFGFLANMRIDNDVYADGGLWTSNFAFGNPDDLNFSVSGNVVLPVQLTSFTAQRQNNSSLLQWSTVSEQNARDFTVERSIDGNNWNSIGVVIAHGNSNTLINYSYTDNDPMIGINYYRLKETDIDGRSTFSETRTVKFTNDNKTFSIIANPVSNGELKIQVNEATLFSLFDISGKLIWKGQLTTGVQTITLNNYIKGIYLLKAKTTTEKIIIQ